MMLNVDMLTMMLRAAKVLKHSWQRGLLRLASSGLGSGGGASGSVIWAFFIFYGSSMMFLFN